MTNQNNRLPAIGIFNDSFPPIIDGVTLTVQNYVRHLSDMGNDVKVVTPWNPEKISTPFEVIRYFSLPIHNRKPYRYGYPRLDPFIWRKLSRTPFRIIHCHCPFSSGRLGVYVAKKQNIPLIGTFHSKYKTDLEHSFRLFPKGVDIIMRRIIDFFNACDEVWIPQAQVEETVREYGYRGKLTVVENGIDYSPEIDSLPTLKTICRQRDSIPENTMSLLFVGQHIREKGVDIIIEALNHAKNNLDFRMNFVGEGYAAEEMKNKVAEYGLENIVKFHGLVKDRQKLSDFYAAADLFLFPSLYDNAPLVVREAASFGTPSILLEGSTASEVISDGYNGFLSAGTPEKFAELLIRLAKKPDEISKTGLNASVTLVRGWKDVVTEVSCRYEDAIKRHCRNAR